MFTPFTPPVRNLPHPIRHSTNRQIKTLPLCGIRYRMISAERSAAFDRCRGICYNKSTKGNTADRRSAPDKITYKEVTLPLAGAVTFLCSLCMLSRSKRWFQESSEQPSAFHSHSSSIPPFPVLPVVRGAVPSAKKDWPPTRYGSTPCEYIIRKCRMPQDGFPAFYFSTC